jgi:hypothetical protein
MSDKPLPGSAEQQSDAASPSGIDLEKAPVEQVLAALGVDPDRGLASAEAANRLDQLQSVMFLQIVPGGHFMLYSTRMAKWFFQPPLPGLPLNAALWATNVLAILMCAFGWLVPQLLRTAIGWVLAYSVAWLFLMDTAKRGTYSAIDRSGRRAAKHRRLVTQLLRP